MSELTVLIFDFPNSAFGPDRTEALRPLAADIADQPGLLWKIWTEEPGAARAGGVYLFATRAAAEAYHAMHAARLAARAMLSATRSLFPSGPASLIFRPSRMRD